VIYSHGRSGSVALLRTKVVLVSAAAGLTARARSAVRSVGAVRSSVDISDAACKVN
jgi:hypothetical protein